MREEKICLQVLGCGDAFSSEGNFHTCFMLKGHLTSALIDCGATSLTAMKRFKIPTNSIDYIFISHFHGDHFGGIPFFLLEASLISKRTKPLTIVGPSGIESKICHLREVLYPNSSSMEIGFSLEFIEMEVDVAKDIGPFRVIMDKAIHSPESSPHSIKIEIDNKCLAYTGDTEWHEGIIDLANGADLLIAESYAFDQNVRHHTTYQELLKNIDRLHCKKVILTHLGPEVYKSLHLLELTYAREGEVYFL